MECLRLILPQPEEPAAPDDSRPADRPEDRWILSRLESTIATVTRLINEYDFAHAAQELYSFVFSDLCDWYLEIAKLRLKSDDAACRWTLYHILRGTPAIVAPRLRRS